MTLWNWFKSLWTRDATNAAIKAATVLADGLTKYQFHLVVDKVVGISTSNMTGAEKADAVIAAVGDPIFNSAYKMPPWVKEGVNVLRTVVQLAWTVAKITKRI